MNYEESSYAIKQQYLYKGGFCPECGEARPPFVKGLPQEVIDTACSCDKNKAQ